MKWEKSERPFQQCTRCILTTEDDPNLQFDEQGVCTLCHIYDNAVKTQVFQGREGVKLLEEIIVKVKKEGEGKPYDCIIGVSGGVDSTYVAWKVKEMGLRPLAIHLDNGWNSELAVNNIENIVKRLDIDLFTYVINWNEFRDLQMSYFKSGVIDLEVPTDHAIMAVLYNLAHKHKVKYILSGHNMVTEGFLPERWIHHKFDSLNLVAIHKKFGNIPLRTFPMLSFTRFMYYTKVVGIQMLPVLNYLPYVKSEAKALIMEKLGWRDYGGKHYESIFTRFYQGYILPEKFGVDKRRSHLSTLICSGQMTKSEALEEIKKHPYPSQELLEEDKEYVIKKLGFTEESFKKYMSEPEVRHNFYPGYINRYHKLRPFIKVAKKILRK